MLKLSNIKKDQLMAFIYYGTVIDIGPDCITVQDVDHNRQMLVSGSRIIETAESADLFDQEEKVTKTTIAEKLISCCNKPFTVCFETADGKERILRGRLIKPEPLLGRSMVEDLDIKKKNKIRLVDHRTLKWLIVENIKWSILH